MTLETLQIGMEWFSERPGGLNRVYAHLLAELDQQGVKSEGLVSGSPDVERISRGLARAFARPGDRLPHRLRALRRAAMPWLQAHDEHALIVSHFAQHALPVLDFARRRPFVVHFQGPWGQESRLEGAPRVTAWMKEMIERRVYHAADAAIVLSSAFAEILAMDLGFPRERIHVIPGGVEAARFAITDSREQARATLGWPTDRPIVLCVRRLVRRVGLELLIDSAVELRSRVPDVLVCIAGSGSIRGELEARIAERQLGDTVRLLGFVPDAHLPQAYRAANLSVVPTIALEGFGLITVESLAAGTACVVTPVDGLREIVEPFAPQLITTSATASAIGDTLARALLGEVTVPDARACAEYARTQFDWPVIATQVRHVYEQVVA